MHGVCLTVARFALAGWVGAAALFVVTAIREVRSPNLDSLARDALVVIRFPAYYAFGFALVGIGLACGCLTLRSSATRTRHAIACVLAALALMLMLVDFWCVYRPLADAVTPPGRVRTESFLQLHRASKWINFGDVSLCLVAAVLFCRPRTSAGGR